MTSMNYEPLWEVFISFFPTLIALITGFILGLGIAFLFKFFQLRNAKQIAEELYIEGEIKGKENLDAVINNMKAIFGNLSLDALSKSTTEFLKLAKSKLDTEREAGARELDAKKGLIDEQLKRMNSDLENVSNLVKDLERDRTRKFGELTNELKTTREQTSALLKTTNLLRQTLASTKQRGQWGERMAEDVLRLAGLMENVNYLKQKTLVNAGTRPDFTLLLPKNLKLNMDVKFPLDNYLKYLDAKSEIEKTGFKNSFMRDVKARIKEVTSRDYINPEQNTLDYALLFIPNEQVYAFIHEQDSTILDSSLKNKVVLCSPLTLFAVLVVIRQAVDSFSLERTSNEIMSLLGTFQKQWEAFVNKMDILGKRLGDAQKEYDALITTRSRQLERPLKKIEDLRNRKSLDHIVD